MDIITNVLALTPVLRLSHVFAAFRFLWQAVQKVEASQEQFRALACFIAQLLQVLDREHREGRMSGDNTLASLNNLRKFVTLLSSQ